MSHDIPKLDRAGLRRFGLVTGGIVVVLFGVLLPWVFGRDLPSWPWIVFGVLAVAAVAKPGALGPVYLGWMKVGNALGWLNTRLILGVLFFLVALPIGLLRRLLGSDPMRRKFDAHAESYRVPSVTRLPKKLEDPF